MTSHDRIVGLIYQAIDEINEMRKPGERIDKTPGTILIGEASPLDSLGFVTLLASVEGEVETQFGQRISLIEIVTSGDVATPSTVEGLAHGISRVVRAEAMP